MTTPTRQRLLQTALKLFACQGVTETTTRQIAEQAGVNEVTLFRQFGNKQGLLLAALNESEWLAHLGSYLQEPPLEANHAPTVLRTYAAQHLAALAQIPEFIRSVVGEAGHYPPETRRALGQALRQANQYATEYFEEAIRAGELQAQLPAQKVASLFNGLLVGYALIQHTTEFHELWDNQGEFLDGLVALMLQGSLTVAQPTVLATVADLPAGIVQELLERAKKASRLDYALVYVLFATGMTPEEIAPLQRMQQWVDDHQHLLRVGTRQVPVNQHILGKRYGSHNNNPLSQWLKSRKDTAAALLIDERGQPLSVKDIQSRWQSLAATLITPEGEVPRIEQARHTWGVEMLLKGVTIETISLLTGLSTAELQPYTQRVREKVALEQALKLDR